MSSHLKQGVTYTAKNKNAKFKVTYTYKQTLGGRVGDKIQLNYIYSKQIQPVTSTLRYGN